VEIGKLGNISPCSADPTAVDVERFGSPNTMFRCRSIKRHPFNPDVSTVKTESPVAAFESNQNEQRLDGGGRNISFSGIVGPNINVLDLSGLRSPDHRKTMVETPVPSPIPVNLIPTIFAACTQQVNVVEPDRDEIIKFNDKSVSRKIFGVAVEHSYRITLDHIGSLLI
jgi:hypothetical protein